MTANKAVLIEAAQGQGSTPFPPLPFVPFKGAFCIPNALPGIPYGDNRRIWTPAFGCYAGTSWQQRIIDETKRRGYRWLEYQLSGRPYNMDYPELTLDVNRIVNDLVLLRQNGIRNIVAFRDDVGPDCSYLREVADATQGLVDCVMGIYESNGVFNWNEDLVLSVLRQQRQLWPSAINAFHSTTQDNGSRGFGEQGFWLKAAEVTDVYFLQQSAWNHTLSSTIDRAFDFIFRLQLGRNGWPQLKHGVILFEETTSMTYRTWTERQGTDVMDYLMTHAPIRPAGYMDGGTV